MRFLPTRVHGIVDYVWGALLLGLPFWLALPEGSAARPTAWIFGAGAIAYSLVTVYEVGLVPIVPMRLHLLLDVLAGAVLAASPWLFGFAGTSTVPFVIFGLFSVVAGLVTRTDPTRTGRLAT